MIGAVGSGTVILASGLVIAALVVLAVAVARQSSYHRGKSDAFREVANDFQGLANCTWWRSQRKAEQAAERKRLMLRLCLCDPLVCDALAAALDEAREHWAHPSSPAAVTRETPSEGVGTVVSEAE